MLASWRSQDILTISRGVVSTVDQNPVVYSVLTLLLELWRGSKELVSNGGTFTLLPFLCSPGPEFASLTIHELYMLHELISN